MMDDVAHEGDVIAMAPEMDKVGDSVLISTWSCAASVINQIADSSRPKHTQTVVVHHFNLFRSK